MKPNFDTSDATKKQEKPSTEGDEPSIEIVRRARGRPPGSRNKPKPSPVVVVATPGSSTTPTALTRPYILEISPGNDVVDALKGFCRRRNLGISILNTTGSISNLTLRQPSDATTASNSAVTFHGRFETLSISGGVFPPNFVSHLAISVAGPQGQIVGGLVVGPMVAANTVTVVAVGYSDPEYVQIPGDEYKSVSAPVSGHSAGRRSDDVEEHHQNLIDHEYHLGGSLAATSFYD